MDRHRDVIIDRLGSRGDGVADTADGSIYIPFALPGETWRVPLYDQATAPPVMMTASADRTCDVCAHFTACGGCVAQHMPSDLYVGWKRELVVEALGHNGITADVRPCAPTEAASRRRTILTAKRGPTSVTLGYHRRGAHELIDVTTCPVVVREIADRLDGLRALATQLLASGETMRLTVVAAREGLDVTADAPRLPVDAEAQALLAQCADDAGLVRLTVNGATMFQTSQPTLQVGDIAVPLPPGVFLQASASAEQKMVALVTAAVGNAESVADLFCGLGTFAVALARHARVRAVDTDATALAALDDGLRRAQRRKTVLCVRRDLFREPLSRLELKDFDAVVFDPPRAGAKAQAEMIAKSAVPKVVAVSCNPGTFARDARALIEGGYTLETVVPIDQFVYSEHVEIVASFRRVPQRIRGQRARAARTFRRRR
ncbi:MAG: methyltransferase [Pseudomonadota bacterium]